MPYYDLDPNTAQVIPAPNPNPASPLINVGLNLGAARDELRSMLQGRTDIEDARLNFWLNRAYIDLATSMAKQDELRGSLTFNTAEDERHYLLPSTVTTTLGVSRSDTDSVWGGVPLEKTDLLWYRRQKDLRDVSDRRPTHFFRLNRLLVLWPTPNDSYEITLDYRYEPEILTADNQSPILRQEWHEAWLILARKKILSAVGEFEASMAVNNEFVGHMRVRLDREAGEDENKVISSSVPRNKFTKRRRSSTGRGYFSDQG